jgi:hypothetical protein
LSSIFKKNKVFCYFQKTPVHLPFLLTQGLCLITRLCFLGEGAKAAAGRRDLARRLEVSRKRDMMAHHQAHIRGQGLSKAGQIFVPYVKCDMKIYQ